jgi:tetratricopeptide (TPR) repeat protein
MMGEQEKAISLFEYNVENYPNSANVYDSLGEALEGAGRAEDALAAYSKAVERAVEIGDQRLGIFTSNRDRVQEQLGSQPD